MEDPVVPSERNLYGHPLAGLVWERQLGKALLEHGWVKSFEMRMLFRELRKSTILLCVCGWYETGWEETKHLPTVERSCETGDLGEPTSFLDHVQLGCSQRECQIRQRYCETITEICFESRISAGAMEKLPFSENSDANISTWSYDMEGHAKKCVERYCELANWTTQQLHKVATPCLDDHQFKKEEMVSVRKLSEVCWQIDFRCLSLARIGRPDILWSVNKLARAVTKWTQACDKR